MFNMPLNSAFSLCLMRDRPIDRALRKAKELGLNQSEFAAALDVQPGHVTNWIRRGLPPSRHEAVAKLLGWTVDELLGHELSKTTPATNEWPFSVRYGEYKLLTVNERLELDDAVTSEFERIMKRRERQRDKMPVKSSRASVR